MRGVLVTYFGSRKFGFLQPEDGGPDVLVHERDFAKSAQPREGAKCEFDIVSDRSRKSGYRAERVKIL